MAKIQVFSPHPDDMDLFVGGTILKHVAEGDTLQIVFMTKGEEGTSIKGLRGRWIGHIRKEEAEARIHEIYRTSANWLHFHDKKIKHTAEATQSVLKAIQAFKPDIIYIPESKLELSFYHHPDHLATGAIVEDAARQYRQSLTLRHYHSKGHNIVMDITPYFSESQKALMHYKNQWGIAIPFALTIYIARVWRYIMTRWWGRKSAYKHAELFREDIYRA